MEKGNKGVKLVGFWVSPFVQRVKWGMKLKGIEYEYIEEDIFNKSPLLSQLNPLTGKVPVLVHDGNPLPESAIILEYLDERWPHAPLLPLDPYERAQARFWARFVEEKILESTWLALCSEGEIQERAVKIAIEHLEMMEEKLGGKNRFFFGDDTIGHVDLMMGFVAYMLPVWEEIMAIKIFDATRFQNLAAWKNNFLNHPVIKGDFPSKDEMFTYFQWRRKVYLKRI
ncbi:glutathione transferase GST 23-like [Salvia miltiorrhiza]|uniref:glutathione transferase GST 23-like n=1 Tax=Salvia miltiorrhiza TaxID=226208 RepID=UPI0025AD6A35|nr:glutathione transferase GST 23-like [Salvia miltiorrhiza]